VLFLDEPTRGIDVGAKVEIYKLMRELAARGAAIIMVSSDLPEVMAMSDRIAVVWGGRIVGQFARGEVNEEQVMSHALGLHEQRAS
jgi:ABC-type sugar transport system ATPase subunit